VQNQDVTREFLVESYENLSRLDLEIVELEFAGRFLSVDPPGKVDDVVRDLLGELVNMIDGNLKRVLARGLRLSMPSVVDGSDYSLRIRRAEVLERIAVQSVEGHFGATVLTTRARARTPLTAP
jgi:CheY-specific phosphatase CheX